MRRTVTLRSNAARQVAVNFMPSRQLPYNTLRIRRSNSEHNALLEESAELPDPEQQADIIVREMEQHQRLMEDNPVSEELRREALRDLPQGLTMKRHVRAKLSASVSLRSKRRPVSMWKRMKYRISFSLKKAHDRLRTLVFSIELWYEAIRTIEGHLGSAVGTYFHFLRCLFAVDVVLCALVVGFVVAPQGVHDRAGYTRGYMYVCNFLYPQGGFQDSLLFYGHYHSGDIAGPLPYNMAFAYFFTMLCSYLLFFAVLCIRTAYSYRRNFISTSDGVPHAVSNKLFSGWDFGIVCRSAAALNSSSIYNEFKELLSEKNKKQDPSSIWIRVFQTLANITITAIVLACIGGLLHRTWLFLTLEKSQHWEIYVSLLVTVTVTVWPLLLNLVVRLEFYRPRTAIYVTLARTWLLDIGVIMVIFFYWAKSGQHCWETSFGQETYRMVMFDALFSLFVLPVVEVLRAFVFKYFPIIGPPEFNIAYNSLTLIYNQSVLWFGMFFSPLLVPAVTLKLLLLFYIKRLTLKTCQPARKVWRAAQTQTVLYMLVTLSLFTTLFVIGSVFIGMPSQQCGPFRSHSRVYEVLSEGVLHLSHHPTAHAAITFLTRPGVIAFSLLFLCVAVYYMRARAEAQRSMVAILRHMLVLQAKDKDFLLGAIDKVSNGEWLYSPKPEGERADSHTWQYSRQVRKPSNSAFHFDVSRLSRGDRPRSHVLDRPTSQYDKSKSQEDGDTDSSFSWQGSSNYLNQKGGEGGEKKWI
ncbi:transmembrane channel-like protein 3 [Amyelois transitella]|uniref:transmembrane channel-like protein 3 n=1 Tax=Amyelois transitella TaxID=680683 RepID=UPI002990141E|nr:transmembrane channel-like protein 3 [Amyelois transitella]